MASNYLALFISRNVANHLHRWSLAAERRFRSHKSRYTLPWPWQLSWAGRRWRCLRGTTRLSLCLLLFLLFHLELKLSFQSESQWFHFAAVSLGRAINKPIRCSQNEKRGRRRWYVWTRYLVIYGETWKWDIFPLQSLSFCFCKRQTNSNNNNNNKQK